MMISLSPISLLLLVVAAARVMGDQKDMFSSTAELAGLVDLELQFVSSLQELADKMSEEVAAIKRYLDRHYNDLQRGQSGEEYVSNPVNSLALVRRLALDLARSDILSILANNKSEERRIEILNMTKTFPTESDWKGSANGIHLLQEFYCQNISQLSSGILELGGTRTEGGESLHAEDLIQIGISAVNAGFHDNGIKWLEMGEERLNQAIAKEGEEEIFMTPNMRSIRDQVETAKQIHDHMLDHRGVVGEFHRCNSLPFDKKLQRKKKYRTARQAQANGTSLLKAEKPRNLVPLYDDQGDSMREGNVKGNFEAICQGEKLRTPDMEVNLGCRLIHHLDPYLMLGPFLLEEHSKQPYITVIRGMMTDEETKYFKKSAFSKLERSSHGGKAGATDTTSFKRTSKQTWLEHRKFDYNLTEVYSKTGVSTEKEANQLLTGDPSWISYFTTRDKLNSTDKVVEKVSNRIELATTMRISTPIGAEAFQVANYGLGGQYSSHLDPHGHWEGKSSHPLHSQTGDRLATWMTFLQDVVAGGATAFPNTGVRIEANKGDTAFWVNLKPSGLLDRLTHHGGCPVLVGSKWITNKWVGYLDQWRLWPCDRGGWSGRYKHFTQYY